MVMDTIQIRMSHGLVEMMDSLVEKGIYANRSDVVRDSVRRFVWEKEAGTVPYKGSAVKLVRKAREELSKQNISLKEINSI